MPWFFDRQREHPEQREELFAIYRKELEELKIPFLILEGEEDVRMKKAIQVLETFNNI